MKLSESMEPPLYHHQIEEEQPALVPLTIQQSMTGTTISTPKLATTLV